MTRAVKLHAGPDGASHVAEGTVALDQFTAAASVQFQESPPHAALDWHEAPERQYAITLTGTLEFTTRDGETGGRCGSKPARSKHATTSSSPEANRPSSRSPP